MQKKRPTGWLYVVGVLVIVGGCTASLGGGFWHVMSSVERLQRVPTPGSQALELERAGYHVYAESRSLVDGAVYRSSGWPALRCSLRTASGERLAIREPTFYESYDMFHYRGTSLFEFDTDVPGTYWLTCETADGAAGPVLAISKGMAQVGSMLAGFVGALIAIAAGVVLIVRTRRRRRRRPGAGPLPGPTRPPAPVAGSPC